MRLRSSIFGSGKETELFHAIQSTWGDRFLILPQLPWTALFDLGKSMHASDSVADSSEFFRKTSVDYVIATRQGEPLLAIEFDGLLQGFSRRSEYVPREQTDNPRRKRNLRLKLEYALQHGLPFFVVGSEEFREWYSDEEDGLELTIVDGLIGYTLSNRLFAQRFHAGAEDALRDATGLPANERTESLQNWADGLEVESLFEVSPFYRETQRFESQLSEAYQGSSYQERARLSFLPEPSHDDEQPGRESVLVAESVRCRCSIRHSELGERSATVAVRNIGQPGTAEDISTQIAELLVWRKLWRAHKKARGLG